MITAFRRWAFDPVDTAPMAALRIACGLLVLGWTVSLLPDMKTFLSDDGLVAHAAGGTRGWWAFDLSSPYWAVGLLLLAAIALLLGWHTRVVSVVVPVLLIVLQRRDVYVLNSGDLLLRHLALFLALMPSGEVWSLDARRRGTSSPRAPWGLRMLQLQISLVYFFSVVAKLHGDSWQDGTAVGRAVQLGDLQRIVVPDAIATSVTMSALMTYGTLVVEGALVFGLWLPRFRWWVMAAGVSIHLGIEATLLIGWFSLTIISCYLAFVPPETMRRVVGLGLARVRPATEPFPPAVTPPMPPPPVPAAAPSSAASPYPLGGLGEQQGHEGTKRLEVRLAPRESVGVDEGLGEPDDGVRNLVEGHGQAEVPDVIDEELLDPVDDERLHAPPVVGEQAEGDTGVGLDRSTEPWVLGAEPGVGGEDSEDTGPTPGPPGLP